MTYAELRNTLREWFRGRVAGVPALATLDLVVPGESSGHGPDDVWMRYSLQMAATSDLLGTGGSSRLLERTGNASVEIFGPARVGDGTVSELATAVEFLWQAAMYPAGRPHPDIEVRPPATFDRPEPLRYCQVVLTPVRHQYFA